jgi:hypothetical protein
MAITNLKPMNTFLDSDLDRIPDYDVYAANLQFLKNIDFSQSSLLDIQKAYDQYATIIPSIFTTRTPEQFNQLYFYRVRMNIVDEDLDLFRTYSYPSPLICKNNGRANLKGKSVFYCSNNPFAAMIESKPRVDQTGYLSIWKAQTTRNIKVGLLLQNSLRTDNIWSDMAKGAYEHVINHSNAGAKSKAKQFVLLHEFIAGLFVTEKNPYPITSMLADQLLFDKDTWKDCILYPSVASDKRYCNFAFHPNVVDQFLKFEKVIPFVVKEVNNNSVVRYTAGQIGKVSNAGIFWDKNISPQDVDFRNLPFD